MSGEHDEDTGLQHQLAWRAAQDQDRVWCPQCGRQAVRVEPWLIASADTGWQYVVALVAVGEGLEHE